MSNGMANTLVAIDLTQLLSTIERLAETQEAILQHLQTNGHDFASNGNGSSQRKGLIDTSEVSEILDISEKTVRKLVREGKITTVRVGRHLKYRPQEIEDFKARESSQLDDSIPLPGSPEITLMDGLSTRAQREIKKVARFQRRGGKS